jgi:hypothetical protein
MSVLLIFIDGLGIGTRGEHNPFCEIDSELFGLFQGEVSRLPFDGKLAITDARLDVEGLPQSATGQTTILSGVNASQVIRKHLHGYPSPRLRQILAVHSIYKRLLAMDRKVTFANCYTPEYFSRKTRFLSATTVAAQTAGLRFRTLDDLEKGEAVCHDFSNYFLLGMGHPVRICTPEQAGERLARLAARHDFTLYEHFIPDLIGHSQNREWALDHLSLLTRFVGAAIGSADLSRQSIVITSDHGNVEDLSTRSHTFNPVPTLAFGAGRDSIISSVKSLTDITPAIVDFLSRG